MALNAPTVGQMKPIELATVNMVINVELVSIYLIFDLYENFILAPLCIHSKF